MDVAQAPIIKMGSCNTKAREKHDLCSPGKPLNYLKDKEDLVFAPAAIAMMLGREQLQSEKLLSSLAADESFKIIIALKSIK